jgi:hypothetical protein
VQPKALQNGINRANALKRFNQQPACLVFLLRVASRVSSCYLHFSWSFAVNNTMFCQFSTFLKSGEMHGLFS